jgi:hypothetical protein
VKNASAADWLLCQAGRVQTRFFSPAAGSCRIGWSASLRIFCGPAELGVDRSVELGADDGGEDEPLGGICCCAGGSGVPWRPVFETGLPSPFNATIATPPSTSTATQARQIAMITPTGLRRGGGGNWCPGGPHWPLCGGGWTGAGGGGPEYPLIPPYGYPGWLPGLGGCVIWAVPVGSRRGKLTAVEHEPAVSGSHPA